MPIQHFLFLILKTIIIEAHLRISIYFLRTQFYCENE